MTTLRPRALARFLVGAALAAFALLPLPALTLVELGNGENTSNLLINFTSGGQVTEAWHFRVSFNGAASGRDLMSMVAGESIGWDPRNDGALVGTFTGGYDVFRTGSTNAYDVAAYGFGDYLTRITIGATSQGASDFSSEWKYWLADPGSDPANNPGAWTLASMGFADRSLADDSWDGWVFSDPAAEFPNSGPAPSFVEVPEPGTGLVLSLPCVLLLRRRR